MTAHINILIISSISNDIDIISVVLLVVKGTAASLYTGVETVVVMLFLKCIPVFNDIDDVIKVVYILLLVLF